jgi:Fe-S cluster assembly protein SufD
MMQTLTIPKGANQWQSPIPISTEGKLVIKVGKDAKVTLMETLKEVGERHVTVEAAPGSHVRMISLQQLPKGELTETLTSHIQKDARVDFFTIHLGGAQIKSTIIHHSEGQNAEGNTDVITHARNDQQLDFILRNAYHSKNGRGQIIAKGVAEDKSKLGINGVIQIDQTGGGTDTHLTQAILNLSPNTTVKATPALEIDTNDVKAGHGANVTNLNEDHLFYMQARGIEREVAQKMLVEGFLKEQLSKLSDLPELQKRIYSIL